MRTDNQLWGASGRWLLVALALFVSAPLRAEPPVPEILEPAAYVDAQPGLLDDEQADSGWPLDETIFTDVEAFTVPAVPIALPEDQAEE